MRVTDTTFTNSFEYNVNNLQEQENNLSGEISSGMNITNPSDNPDTFAQFSQQRSAAIQSNQYLNVSNTLYTQATATYNGVSSMQKLLTNASEIMTQANETNTSTQYQVLGTQMLDLANELATTINTQSDGVYIYGSTGNQPPLVTNSSAPPAYTFNTSAAYTSQVPSTTINEGTTVSTGLTAGNPTSGSSFNGILYNSSTMSRDIYTMLATTAQQLLGASGSGDPFAASGGYSAVSQEMNNAVSQMSSMVGIASAQMAQVQTNINNLNQQITNQNTDIDSLVDANTATVATNLSNVETSYQAALSSGAKIMGMTLLDYLS